MPPSTIDEPGVAQGRPLPTFNQQCLWRDFGNAGAGGLAERSSVAGAGTGRLDRLKPGTTLARTARQATETLSRFPLVLPGWEAMSQRIPPNLARTIPAGSRRYGRRGACAPERGRPACRIARLRRASSRLQISPPQNIPTLEAQRMRHCFRVASRQKKTGAGFPVPVSSRRRCVAFPPMQFPKG
jgi:hypothetical protein